MGRCVLVPKVLKSPTILIMESLLSIISNSDDSSNWLIDHSPFLAVIVIGPLIIADYSRNGLTGLRLISFGFRLPGKRWHKLHYLPSHRWLSGTTKVSDVRMRKMPMRANWSMHLTNLDSSVLVAYWCALNFKLRSWISTRHCNVHFTWMMHLHVTRWWGDN